VVPIASGERLPTDFKHPIPVFPLPDLVLFPHAILPLHVYELRYRTLVRDALSRDRVILLALLKPGHELDYQGSPEFHSLGCLARFEDVEWLPNDRYDLRVLGTSRAHVTRVVGEFPYRSVRVEPLPEHPFDEEDPIVQIEKRALLDGYRRWTRRLASLAGERADQALASVPSLSEEMSYAGVVNTVCMLSGASAAHRLSLLAEDSVIERGRRVRELLEGRLRQRNPAPPSGETN
jgi:Lon protease-like protein